MTDTLQQNDDGTLAAEYVLGTLPEAERRAFAARLGSDAALRQQVQYWEAQFSSFNADYASANPPPALRGAVHERLFGPEEKKGFLQSLGFWRGLSFATLATLAITVAVPYFSNPAPKTTSVAELALQQGGGVQLAAYFDADKKLIRYARVSDAPLSGRDFELWVIIGKDAPVSLGVVPSDKSGVIKVSADLATKMADATLAISDEPKGGSPTGKATGAILSVGKLTPI
jgi:anti-sigma-K factor RskA